MTCFQALMAKGDPKDPSSIQCSIQEMEEQELQREEVEIATEYSSINYKDALAVCGKGRILRKTPLIPGIDAAGTVRRSRSSHFSEGDKVLVTGCGIGESFHGGFAERLTTKSSSLVRLPSSYSTRTAMLLGTAGFTAALCLHRLGKNGIEPDSGPVAVTGASGGVGSMAVRMLSQLGYEVVAISGKQDAKLYLESLGARSILSPENLELSLAPLAKGRWAAVIDNVGGQQLSSLLAHTLPWGSVASVGLAAGERFESTVMPFILRGVSLLGISSNNCPSILRQELWEYMEKNFNSDIFMNILNKTVNFTEVVGASKELLERRQLGRVLVEITRNLSC